MTPKEFWDAAIGLGFFPLCIQPGTKMPAGGAGWTSWTAPKWFEGTDTIGLRCGDGGLHALDVDVSDPTLSAAMLAAFRAELGAVPVRYGNRPRFLIPYISQEPVDFKNARFPNGEKLQMLGKGAQFIAFGAHPEAGAYTWDDADKAWPTLSKEMVLRVLANATIKAGTSLEFSAQVDAMTSDEIEGLMPRNDMERRAAKHAAEEAAAAMTAALTGVTEGRGTLVFAYCAPLKAAELAGVWTREETYAAIEAAGHRIDDKHGGRSLREEVCRRDAVELPRGNRIAQAIARARELSAVLPPAPEAFPDVPEQLQPTPQHWRSGFEIDPSAAVSAPPWVIWDVVMRGEMAMFVGPAKRGKSTVVTDMCLRVVEESKFWGKHVCSSDAKGHVLWLAFEDHVNTRLRFQTLLEGKPELASRVHVMQNVSKATLLPIVQTFCQGLASRGERLDLIVIDTLSKAMAWDDENAAGEITQDFAMLEKLARDANVPVLGTDHMKKTSKDDKADDEGYVFSDYRGSSAKLGATGSMIYLGVHADDTKRLKVSMHASRGGNLEPMYCHVTSKTLLEHEYGDVTINLAQFDDAPAEQPKKSRESVEMVLAGWLAGAQEGLAALGSGYPVTYPSVGNEVHLPKSRENHPPTHASTLAALKIVLGADFRDAEEKELVFKLNGKYMGIRAPQGFTPTATVAWEMPWNED